MSDDEAPDRPGRMGRPRDRNVDTALADACRSLLADGGYSELSIEAVARVAGVSRPAIYRRWKSKAQMVSEVVLSEVPRSLVEIPHTDDVVADLTIWARNFHAFYAQPEVAATGSGILAEWVLHPEVHEQVWDGVRQPVLDAFAARVAEAVAHGDVRADADAELLLNVLIGVTSYLTMLGIPPDEDLIERLVVTLLDGVRVRRQ